MSIILMYFLFFGFWGSLIIKNPLQICAFSSFYFLFLSYRFSKKSFLFIPLVILSIFLSLPQNNSSIPGVYTVYEIHSKYVVGQKDGQSIILYGLENVDYYDEVNVSYLEEIDSLKNENLFDFQEYMKKQGIYKFSSVSDEAIIRKSESLKSKIYRKLKWNTAYQKYFYGIYNEEDIDSMFTSLGLGFISFIYLLKKTLFMFIKKEKSDSICLGLSILSGSLFNYSPSLVRFILSQFVSKFTNESHKKLCFTYFLFLIFFPNKADSFVCVFPFFIQWMHLIEKDSLKRRCYSLVLILGMQILFFHKINLVSLFVFSFARFVLGIGYLTTLLSVLFPFLQTLINLIDCLIRAIPKLQITYVPSIAFLILFFSFYITKWKKSIFVVLGICIFFESRMNPFFNIYMINIGQGDCTLIVEPYQKSTILIDCGQNMSRDNVKEIVIPFLENLQIHKIDYVIQTHDDYDHSGGIDELCEQFKVSHVIKTSQNNIVDYPFYFLLEDRDYEEENDNSLITYFSYDGFDYLWTGDASNIVEEKLLHTYDLSNVDVFKLGHHGSKTSSCLKFLESMTPKLGLISVAKKNYYGHPSSEVVGRCIEQGINLLQTKDVGSIHLFSLPHILFFACANGECGVVQTK